MKRVLSGCAVAVVVLSACAKSTPPPAPAPAVAKAPGQPLPHTIEEAIALHRAGSNDVYEAGLRALVKSTDPQVQRRALAMLAVFLQDQKRYDEAAPVMAQAADAYPEIAPSLRLHLVEIEEQRKAYDSAINAARAIVTAAPDSAAAAVARLRLPGLLAAKGDVTATDAAYRDMAALAIDELTEDEWVRAADRLATAGRFDLAEAIRMRLVTTYTSGRYTEKIYGQLAQMPASPLEFIGFNDSLDLANKLAKADRYDQALEQLKRVQRRFPEAQTSDLYRNVRVRALFNSRNYTTLLTETDPATLGDPALLMLRSRAAWRAGRPQEFLSGLQLLEQKYPASKEAIDAKVQRSKYYVTDVVDFQKSVNDLQAAINAGAVGTDGENIWNLGWTFTQWGLANIKGANGDLSAANAQFTEALNTFKRYVTSYPDGDYKTNSLFWAAKINEKLGRMAERDSALQQVVNEYPYSYYAYRAREIMGQPLSAPSSVANANVFPDIDAAVASVNDPRLAAIDELVALDLERDATREMKRVAAAYPDNPGIQFKLADVYVRGGEPFRANSIVQRRFRDIVRHGGQNVPQRFWEVLFPLAYWDRIQAEAKKQNVDPYQVAAIIRQESGFEPSTVSNAGAVGLMQIMPAEAARLGEAAGLTDVTREKLFDPAINIAVGAAEFRQKLNRMNDNSTLATAAYNAGEEPVGRWLAQTPVDDIDLFVETIPYAETRLYVKTVTRNRFEYRRIYEGSNSRNDTESRTP